MKIYKFFKLRQKYIDTIKESKVWLSAPIGFNDMNDCKIGFIGKTRSDGSGNDFENINKCLNILYSQEYYYPTPLKKEVTDLLRLYIQDIHITPLGQHIYDTRLAGQILESINSITLEKSGVSCFSGEKAARNSDLMWAHYADNHRGFCIEYEYDEREFSLFAVTYSSHPIMASAKEFLFTPDEIFVRLLTTKSVEWMYEDEWRIVEINCLDDVDVANKGKTHILPEGLLAKRLITGKRFEDNKNGHHGNNAYDKFENEIRFLKDKLGIETISYDTFTEEKN